MSNLHDMPSNDVISTDVWTESAERRKDLLMGLTRDILNCYTDIAYHSSSVTGRNAERDRIHEHSVQLLSIGLMYIYSRDAIKEGDGNRVLRSWRYMLPIFIGSGRKNYAKEALMLIGHQELLPGRLSQQMLWSRFVNVSGGKGKNIPADLHNEH